MGGEIVRLWVASDRLPRRHGRQRKPHGALRRASTASCATPSASCWAISPDSIRRRDRVVRDRNSCRSIATCWPAPRELDEKILGWYDAFEFHRVYQAVNEFAIVDLSSFYLDVLKDRMYTFAPTSQARRSAQTVLWQITEALVRLVAPILSFTADEVWEYLPANSPAAKRAFTSPSSRSPKRSSPAIPRSVAGRMEADLRGSRRSAARARRSAPGQAHRQGPRSRRRNRSLGRVARTALQRHAAGLKEFINVSAVRVIESDARSVRLPSPLFPPAATNAPAAGTSCPKSPTTASGRTSAPAATPRSKKWVSIRPALPIKTRRRPPRELSRKRQPSSLISDLLSLSTDRCSLIPDLCSLSRRPQRESPCPAQASVAAAHLGCSSSRRSLHQDRSSHSASAGRRHPGHPRLSAHHPLAQRGRGLLALRRLRLAQRRSLGLIAFSAMAGDCRPRSPSFASAVASPSPPSHWRSSSAARLATCTTASATARSSTSSKSTSSAITGPTSTWPTAPSSSAPACCCSTPSFPAKLLNPPPSKFANPDPFVPLEPHLVTYRNYLCAV